MGWENAHIITGIQKKKQEVQSYDHFLHRYSSYRFDLLNPPAIPRNIIVKDL